MLVIPVIHCVGSQTLHRLMPVLFLLLPLDGAKEHQLSLQCDPNFEFFICLSPEYY